jgi:hypothetical protein
MTIFREKSSSTSNHFSSAFEKENETPLVSTIRYKEDESDGKIKTGSLEFFYAK